MNLKYKTLIFFLIFNLSTLGLLSQPIMGVQAGVNISSLGGHKEYAENQPRLALSAYVFTDIPLGNNTIVSIETGLGFSQQGMNHTRIIEELASQTTTKISNKLDYLILPIYLKENLTNFYTKIGPYAAYLVNVQSTYKSTVINTNQTLPEVSGTNEEFVKNANLYDLGLSFGFGYIHFFDTGRRRPRRKHGKRVVPVLQVDLRYNLGLKTIDSKGDTPDMNYKNRTFTIGLTITSVQNK